MSTLPANLSIASAHVVLNGKHGEVSQHARSWEVSRQALYRKADALQKALDPQKTQEQFQLLKLQVQQDRLRIELLQKQQNNLVLIDNERIAHFAVLAAAEGVSLPTTRRLLKVLQGDEAPSVSKLGRFTKEAANKAAGLLEVLDQYSAPAINQACADEIFVGKRPVLMVVEPQSLVWQCGNLVEHRDGPTWANEFEKLPALEQLTRDGGTGMAKGIEQVNVQRGVQGRCPVVEQLDHFHLQRDAKRALRTFQSRASQALEKAEKAQKALDQLRRRGKNQAGAATAASRAWRQAEEAMQLWVAQERLWSRVEQALLLFDGQGELNSRAKAEGAVAEASAKLEGSCWNKVRRQLQQPTLFSYLDRLQGKLSEVEGEESAKQLLLRAEGLRRCREAMSQEGSQGGLLRSLLLLISVLLSKLGVRGLAMQSCLRKAVEQTVRASSVVEGVNSVVRMHQGRHRRLSQGLLDLKRLNWNVRRFRTGKRKRKSPYELLGVRLPADDWWELLKLTPEQLRAEVSALNPTK